MCIQLVIVVFSNVHSDIYIELTLKTTIKTGDAVVMCIDCERRTSFLSRMGRKNPKDPKIPLPYTKVFNGNVKINGKIVYMEKNLAR